MNTNVSVLVPVKKEITDDNNNIIRNNKENQNQNVVTNKLKASQNANHSRLSLSQPPSSQSQTQTQQQKMINDNEENVVIKEEKKEVPRLVMTKMVLINFKSYKNRIEIGPFHKVI